MEKILKCFIDVSAFLSSRLSGSLSYYFFTRPRKGKFHDIQSLPAVLRDAKRINLHVEKKYIQVYQWGSGSQKVLLVHGWESNAARWSPLLSSLDLSHYTIYALDAPGSGLSSGNRLNTLEYAKSIKSCIKNFEPNMLIAHSLGGFCTLAALQKYRYESIQKVVLLAPLNDFEIIMKNYQAMLGFSDLGYTHFEKKVERMLDGSLKTYKSHEFVKGLQIPLLLIHDENDEVVPIQDSYSIKKYAVNAKMEVIKGTNHSLQNEEVYQKIKLFLD